MADNVGTRMERLGYRTPTDAAEPDEPVLVEYLRDGRVALITLNRPHADNPITTELAASLIEIREPSQPAPPCASPSSWEPATGHSRWAPTCASARA